MLRLKDLHVSYGSVRALRGVNLDLERGEIVTLIGANGAGKSTTLNTIIGLVRPSGGTIEYNGKPIGGKPTHGIVADKISLVPEARRIFLNLTVRENLEIGAFLNKDLAKIEGLKGEVFTLFPHLKERQGQIGGTLSGGEQQMLAIARALMQEPDLLLLDEPSLGLAPNLVQEIFAKVKDINSRGTSILLVEQNAFQALKIADRGYVLENGEIVLSGKGADLAADPTVQKAYLGK
jgi:branched-chain amino acid transport system ATP-binding protein